MSNYVHELGDNTTHDVKPDFESGRGYYWMKQTVQANNHGWGLTPPRKPRKNLAEHSFFEQVDRRLSRYSSVVNIRFDSQGRRIHE